MIGVSTWSFDNFGLEPEAVALIARMTTPPDAQRIALINSTYRGLKTAGILSKLDALWVMAAHDSQAAGLNWINSSHTLSPVNSPTFTVDRGYAGDGATSYMDTNYNPATHGVNLTQNSGSFGVWSMTSAQQSTSIAGWLDGSDGITILPRSSGNVFSGRVNTGITVTGSVNGDGMGFYVVSRSDASTQSHFKNGALANSDSRSSTAINSNNLYIGRSAASSYVSAQISVCLIGANLSDEEHAGLYTAMNAYLTGIGAI